MAFVINFKITVEQTQAQKFSVSPFSKGDDLSDFLKVAVPGCSDPAGRGGQSSKAICEHDIAVREVVSAYGWKTGWSKG